MCRAPKRQLNTIKLSTHNIKNNKNNSVINVKNKNKNLKKKTKKVVCCHCKRSKVRCEGGFPCDRCIRLNKSDTCVPIVHRKRGRKRKNDMTNNDNNDNNDIEVQFKFITNNYLVTKNNEEKEEEEVKNNKRIKIEKTNSNNNNNNNDNNNDNYSNVLLQHNENDCIEYFNILLKQYNMWYNKILLSKNKNDEEKFIWFCNFILKDINEHINYMLTISNGTLYTSTNICYELLNHIKRNKDLSLPPHESIKYSKDAERAIFDITPMGIISFTIDCDDLINGHGYHNIRACELLKYDHNQLQEILNNKQFYRLLHSSSYEKFYSQFFECIKYNNTHFNNNLQWLNSHGDSYDMTCTFNIKYSNTGLPNEIQIFLQDPALAVNTLKPYVEDTVLDTSDVIGVNNNDINSNNDDNLFLLNNDNNDEVSIISNTSDEYSNSSFSSNVDHTSTITNYHHHHTEKECLVTKDLGWNTQYIVEEAQPIYKWQLGQPPIDDMTNIVELLMTN